MHIRRPGAKALMLIGFMLVALAGASPLFAAGGKEAAPERPIVMVSILPQAYFVERIAGDRVAVSVLVGPGQSPHSYEPTPRQMADLAKASMWLSIGVEFEKALKPKVAELYKNLPVIDTTVGIDYRMLEAHDHEDDHEDDHHGHDHKDDHHGHDDEHDPSGVDAHVWLGRQAVQAMALTIRDALSSFDPAGAASYAANHAAFARDVDAAFDTIVARLEPLRGTTAFVFHPAFGYLLDELGMRQEAVETGGKEPTQKALAAMIALAKEEGARVIFVQEQFPTSAASAVATAIGGAVVPINPLARDWLDNLSRMADALERAAR